MRTFLEVAVFDATLPVVIGVAAFAVLLVALGYVRGVGNGRPHAK